MKYFSIFILTIVVSTSTTAFAGKTKKFQTIKVNGHEINLPIFSIFVVPNTPISIKVKDGAANLTFTFENRVINRKFIRNWRFNAPVTPGLYELKGKNKTDGTAVKINVFVLVPYNRMAHGKVEGYRIDAYPPPKNLKSIRYTTPAGFIRVNKKDKDILLTPHFRLSQFLCKQISGYPQFLVLKENLLLLLEDLLQQVRQEGYDIKTFGFISGYRTPFYNKKIGNVRYSRHIYGDAADIFVDTSKDGRMDDLNRDGKVNISDARILYDIAVNLKKMHTSNDYKGGIGLYKPTAHHSGFIHIDTRGYPARWE